jgi:hypothetical protein
MSLKAAGRPPERPDPQPLLAPNAGRRFGVPGPARNRRDLSFGQLDNVALVHGKILPVRNSEIIEYAFVNGA